MNSHRIFRALVVAATAIYVVWFLQPYGLGDLPDVEHQLLEHDRYGALLPVQHPLFYCTWFCLWLVASVGLFLLQNWARHLFLALYVIGIALVPFAGFTVQLPIDTALSAVNTLLNGAILALAYLTPVSASFRAGPYKSSEPMR
jgi:hypothetical protein